MNDYSFQDDTHYFSDDSLRWESYEHFGNMEVEDSEFVEQQYLEMLANDLWEEQIRLNYSAFQTENLNESENENRHEEDEIALPKNSEISLLPIQKFKAEMPSLKWYSFVHHDHRMIHSTLVQQDLKDFSVFTTSSSFYMAILSQDHLMLVQDHQKILFNISISFSGEVVMAAHCVILYNKNQILIYDFNGSLQETANLSLLDSAKVSPNGNHLLVKDNDEVQVFDLSMKKLILISKLRIQTNKFCLFGDCVVYAIQNEVYMINPLSLNSSSSFEREFIEQLFSTPNQLYVILISGAIIIYNLNFQKCQELRISSGFSNVKVSNDDKTMVVTYNSEHKMLDLTTQKNFMSFNSTQPVHFMPNSSYGCLTFSSDGIVTINQFECFAEQNKLLISCDREFNPSGFFSSLPLDIFKKVAFQAGLISIFCESQGQ